MELCSLTEENSTEIRESYERLIHKDIHFDLDYLRIFARYNRSELMYVKYGDNENYMMIPYYKRAINGHFDIISPWYFGGPIFTTTDKETKKKLYSGFRNDFEEVCNDMGIISEFTRFDPVICNSFPEVDGSSVCLAGRSVVVNLDRPDETIKMDFKKRVKKNINSGRNKGLTIEIPEITPSSYSEFKQIYLDTMRSIEANEYYFFDDQLFSDLFDILREHMILYLIKHEGKTISATIDLGRYGTMHDFLRGTLREYLKLNPSYLLMNGIIEETNKRGFQSLSIGGGRSCSDDDPLFFFKSSFSNDIRPFYVFKKVYDMKTYTDLCCDVKVPSCQGSKANFFPEYRK